MDQTLSTQSTLSPRQKLAEVLRLTADIDHNWALRTQLRADLVSDLANPNVDTSDLKGLVSLQHRKAKLDVPEIVALRHSIAEAKDLLYGERQQEIYDAQMAVQLAEEALQAVLTTEQISRMSDLLLQLEYIHAGDKPELTSSLIVRKAAKLNIV